MKITFKKSKAISLAFITTAFCQIAMGQASNETVGLQSFTYHRPSPLDEPVTVSHWGADMDQMLIDDYNITPDEHQFKQITDLVVRRRGTNYQFYFVGHGNNYISHSLCASISDFPGEADQFGHFHGGSIVGDDGFLRRPKGIDALGGGTLTQLYVTDHPTDRLVVYDHTDEEIIFRVASQDPPRLVRPTDIARFAYDPYSEVFPWVAVLVYDGWALALYNVDALLNPGNYPNEEYNGFRSSWGLPQEYLPPTGVVDGHVNFFCQAQAVYSQRGKIYVADTGHHRIVEFTVHPQTEQLQLARIYDLGANALPTSISGDAKEDASESDPVIYVADKANNVVIKYSTYQSQYTNNGALVEIDRIGDDPTETVQMTGPRVVAALDQELFVAEEYTATTGLVHGEVGGMVKNVIAYPDPNDTRDLQVYGTATGNVQDVRIELQSVNGPPYEYTSYEMGDLKSGPIRFAGQGSPAIVHNTDPFQLYAVRVSWTSNSCTQARCFSAYDDNHVMCGDLGPAPVMSPPQLYTVHIGPQYEYRWDFEENVQSYVFQWKREQDPSWNECATQSNWYNIYSSQPGYVYEVRVCAVRNGVRGQFSEVVYFAHPIESQVINVSIGERTSAHIVFSSELDNVNGFRVYFGTDLNSLSNYKDFMCNGPQGDLLFDESDLPEHNAVWHFDIAGGLYTSLGVLIQEGPRLSSPLSTPLAPTASGTISWPERWFAEYDPVVTMSANVTVADGASLTIDPGVIVNAGSHSLNVYGDLNAIGTPVDHILFVGNQPQVALPTLASQATANVNMQYSEVVGGFFGYLVRGGSVSIDNCVFEQNRHGLVLINSSPSISNSRFFSNTPGYGAVIIRSEPVISECEFTGNARSGLLVWNTDYTSIHDCDFLSNGFDNPTVWSNGIRMLNGHVFMTCNTVQGNAGPGVAVLQGYLDNDWSDLQGSGRTGARNIYADNMADSANLGHLGQIWLEGAAAFNADYALNSFGGSTFIGSNSSYRAQIPGEPDDEGGPAEYRLFYDFYLRGNYWGTQDPSIVTAGVPSISVVEPLLVSEYDCQTTSPTFPDPDPALTFFNQGMVQELSGNIEAAIVTYKVVLDDYPTSKQAPIATQRLAVCYSVYGETWSEIRDHFLAMADTVDPVIKMVCKNSAAWCLVEMGDLQSAEAEFQALIDQSHKDYEVLYNSMGKLMSQLEEEDWGSLGVRTGNNSQSVSNSDSKSTEARKKTPSKVKVEATELSSAQSQKFTDNLSKTLDGIDSLLGIARSGSVNPTLPTTFALYQNYPNPFNPSTEIRFDLPEAIRVELKVFNILGQEVVTLVDDVRSAGAYRILWDGKNAAGLSVASGVYVYQFKTPNFTDAKKMLLLR